MAKTAYQYMLPGQNHHGGEGNSGVVETTSSSSAMVQSQWATSTSSVVLGGHCQAADGFWGQPQAQSRHLPGCGDPPACNEGAPLDRISLLQAETSLLFHYYRYNRNVIVWDLPRVLEDSLNIKQYHDHMIDWILTTINRVVVVGMSDEGLDCVICTASSLLREQQKTALTGAAPADGESRASSSSSSSSSSDAISPLHVMTKYERGPLYPRHEMPSYLFLSAEIFLYCCNAKKALSSFCRMHDIQGICCFQEDPSPTTSSSSFSLASPGARVSAEDGYRTAAPAAPAAADDNYCQSTSSAAEPSSSSSYLAPDWETERCHSYYTSPSVWRNWPSSLILPPPYIACQSGLWLNFYNTTLHLEEIQDRFDDLGVMGYTDIKLHYPNSVGSDLSMIDYHERPTYVDVQFLNMATMMEAYDTLRMGLCAEVLLRQQAAEDEKFSPLVQVWPDIPFETATRQILPALNLDAGGTINDPLVKMVQWWGSTTSCRKKNLSPWIIQGDTRIGQSSSQGGGGRSSGTGVQVMFQSFDALRRCRGKEYTYGIQNGGGSGAGAAGAADEDKKTIIKTGSCQTKKSKEVAGYGGKGGAEFQSRRVRVLGSAIFEDVVHCTLDYYCYSYSLNDDAGSKKREEEMVREAIRNSCPGARPRGLCLLTAGAHPTWQFCIDPMSALVIHSKGGINLPSGAQANVHLTFWENTYEWRGALDGSSGENGYIHGKAGSPLMCATAKPAAVAVETSRTPTLKMWSPDRESGMRFPAEGNKATTREEMRRTTIQLGKQLEWGEGQTGGGGGGGERSTAATRKLKMKMKVPSGNLDAVDPVVMGEYDDEDDDDDRIMGTRKKDIAIPVIGGMTQFPTHTVGESVELEIVPCLSSEECQSCEKRMEEKVVANATSTTTTVIGFKLPKAAPPPAVGIHEDDAAVERTSHSIRRGAVTAPAAVTDINHRILERPSRHAAGTDKELLDLMKRWPALFRPELERSRAQYSLTGKLSSYYAAGGGADRHIIKIPPSTTECVVGEEADTWAQKRDGCAPRTSGIGSAGSGEEDAFVATRVAVQSDGRSVENTSAATEGLESSDLGDQEREVISFAPLADHYGTTCTDHKKVGQTVEDSMNTTSSLSLSTSSSSSSSRRTSAASCLATPTRGVSSSFRVSTAFHSTASGRGSLSSSLSSLERESSSARPERTNINNIWEKVQPSPSMSASLTQKQHILSPFLTELSWLGDPGIKPSGCQDVNKGLPSVIEDGTETLTPDSSEPTGKHGTSINEVQFGGLKKEASAQSPSPPPPPPPHTSTLSPPLPPPPRPVRSISTEAVPSPLCCLDRAVSSSESFLSAFSYQGWDSQVECQPNPDTCCSLSGGHSRDAQSCSGMELDAGSTPFYTEAEAEATGTCQSQSLLLAAPAVPAPAFPLCAESASLDAIPAYYAADSEEWCPSDPDSLPMMMSRSPEAPFSHTGSTWQIELFSGLPSPSLTSARPEASELSPSPSPSHGDDNRCNTSSMTATACSAGRDGGGMGERMMTTAGLGERRLSEGGECPTFKVKPLSLGQQEGLWSLQSFFDADRVDIPEMADDGMDDMEGQHFTSLYTGECYSGLTTVDSMSTRSSCFDSDCSGESSRFDSDCSGESSRSDSDCSSECHREDGCGRESPAACGQWTIINEPLDRYDEEEAEVYVAAAPLSSSRLNDKCGHRVSCKGDEEEKVDREREGSEHGSCSQGSWILADAEELTLINNNVDLIPQEKEEEEEASPSQGDYNSSSSSSSLVAVGEGAAVVEEPEEATWEIVHDMDFHRGSNLTVADKPHRRVSASKSGTSNAIHGDEYRPRRLSPALGNSFLCWG